MPLKVVPISNELPGFAPLPQELVTGELALNTCDGVLYTKLSDGTITSVCCGGSSAPAAASALSEPEHYYGIWCGRGPGDGCPVQDAPTSIDAVMCDFCTLSIQWTVEEPNPCSPAPDYFEFQYSLNYGATWVTMSSVTMASLGGVSGGTTSMPRPSDAVGLFQVQVVNVSVGGTHDGRCGVRSVDGSRCACDPPPPPPPTRFECIDGACVETSGTPDFAASWPTLGECTAQMTCDEDVQSWTCSGTTCTLTPGVAPDGITHFATSGACTTACVESWTCSGSTCTHTPGVAADGFTHYATSLLCTAACETPDYLSYTCASGNVQPSLVAPDYVTYFETELSAQSNCGVTFLAPAAARCLFRGDGILDPITGIRARRYGWDTINSPGQPCQFSDVANGWNELTDELLWAPKTPGSGDTIGPYGESLYTYADGPHAGVSIRFYPHAACGTCDAAHENQDVSLPCTVYNAAP